MKLIFTGDNKKIADAVAVANHILASQAFFEAIKVYSIFQYSTYSGSKVADELSNFNGDILVDTYWWWSPFGVATAKTKTEINVNTATLNRPLASIVNTLVHESVHFVDWAINKRWDYTDKNAYEDPPKSATYVIGFIAEEMARDYVNQV